MNSNEYTATNWKTLEGIVRSFGKICSCCILYVKKYAKKIITDFRFALPVPAFQKRDL